MGKDHNQTVLLDADLLHTELGQEHHTLENTSNKLVNNSPSNKKSYIVPKLSYEGEWDAVTMGANPMGGSFMNGA